MLNRLRSWLDANADARRAAAAATAAGRAKDAGDAAPTTTTAAASTPRREGLRPRAGAAAVAGAVKGGEAYVLVTVGTTKFEALIRCVSFGEGRGFSSVSCVPGSPVDRRSLVGAGASRSHRNFGPELARASNRAFFCKGSPTRRRNRRPRPTPTPANRKPHAKKTQQGRRHARVRPGARRPRLHAPGRAKGRGDLRAHAAGRRPVLGAVGRAPERRVSRLAVLPPPRPARALFLAFSSFGSHLIAVARPHG